MKQNLLSLAGKKAVITGGASGLGKEIAAVFAEQGAEVVVLDLPKSKPIEVARTIATEAPKSSVIGIEADVTSVDQMKSAFQHEKLQDIDILVNSAGIREIAPVYELEFDAWNKVLAVNLTGTFNATKLASEALKKSENGAVVNISSVAGITSQANRPAYSASKHGVIGLTQNLAHDLGPYGVRVNALAPGAINTPLTQAYYADADFKESLKQGVPLNREGTVRDVANTALYLVSPLANFVSGAVVPVDGGWVGQKNYVPSASSGGAYGAAVSV